MLEIDHKLVVYHENLRRLRRHLEVLQQIHLAPAAYLNAVAEVVRRRAFSQAFLSVCLIKERKKYFELIAKLFVVGIRAGLLSFDDTQR